MEGGIIAVVEVRSAVHRRTAKEQNIVSFDEEVGILEAHVLGIRFLSLIDQILHKLPIFGCSDGNLLTNEDF